MFAAFVAGLTALLSNPTVDAALLSAGRALIDWWNSLSEEDKAKIEVAMQAARASAVGQLTVFDQGLAAFRKHLDELAAHDDEKVKATGKALEDQLVARFAAPLPAPQIVNTNQGE